ncbi:MAG: nuclear transport factor 2 family protein [Acidobacteriota bacterium]
MAAESVQAIEPMTSSEIVNRYFSAYETQDRPVVEDLLTDDFTFTSPNDEHIDKAVYFERCWQFSHLNPTFRFVKLVESGGDVFVLYECTPKDGATFRNTEFFQIGDGKIKAIEVYFGSLPTSGKEDSPMQHYETLKLPKMPKVPKTRK